MRCAGEVDCATRSANGGNKVSDRSAKNLARFLAGAGVSHFVVPHVYDEIVPHALPGPPRMLDAVERRRRRRIAGDIDV